MPTKVPTASSDLSAHAPLAPLEPRVPVESLEPVAGSAAGPSPFPMAHWTRTMKRSVLRQMLAVVSRPGIISFAGGLPAPELFPAKAYAEATSRVLATDPRALQYGPPFGPLKAHIVRLMAERGVTCEEQQIFITTGAQQALALWTGLLLNHDGQVMTEQLIYTGIQQAIALYRPQLLTVPTDLETGIDVDAVEAHLQSGARPAFLYAITEAHNPLGVSIPPENQERLVALARRYGMPIIEDDPYGFLRYEAAAVPAMRSLDDQWVLYVGSFSKILAPGLRLGWTVVPEALLPTLTVIKESIDLETSAFIQRTVAAYLDAGHLPGHIAGLRLAYRERRDAMLAAMERYFPAGARWTRPTGGMFIWVELPPEVDATALLWTAVDEVQVAYIPGDAFWVDAGLTGPAAGCGAHNCMRLNFSNCTPEVIDEGIRRLGKLLHELC